GGRWFADDGEGESDAHQQGDESGLPQTPAQVEPEGSASAPREGIVAEKPACGEQVFPAEFEAHADGAEGGGVSKFIDDKGDHEQPQPAKRQAPTAWRLITHSRNPARGEKPPPIFPPPPAGGKPPTFPPWPPRVVVGGREY